MGCLHRYLRWDGFLELDASEISQACEQQSAADGSAGYWRSSTLSCNVQSNLRVAHARVRAYSKIKRYVCNEKYIRNISLMTYGGNCDRMSIVNGVEQIMSLIDDHDVVLRGGVERRTGNQHAGVSTVLQDAPLILRPRLSLVALCTSDGYGMQTLFHSKTIPIK